LNGKITDRKKDMYIAFKKISRDTVYIKVNNSDELTQRSGTAGAMMYLAKATYNLTELNGILYVNMDFEEGDHAMPGTFSRKYFSNRSAQ